MSTPAEREAISKILKATPNPCIIELGAYDGSDSAWMREVCGNTHSINVIVEPDPRNMAIIRALLNAESTVLVEAAIAAHSGTVNFYFGDDRRVPGRRSGSGSIRNPEKHTGYFPDINFGEPTPVLCWSLDHLAASLGIHGAIDLLWVDIQGAERDMIAGGHSALSRTRYIFIEAEEVELYEGQALRPELLAMLPGFKVIGEFEYNLLLEAK